MNKLNKIFLSNKNSHKSASGITLIALVITIIVLLILAGVTIAMLTGSDSAPAKANEAKQKNDIGTAKDDVAIAVQNAQTDAYEAVYVNGTQVGSTTKVTAGEASNTVGAYVISQVKAKYDANSKVGLATVVIGSDGAVTISTTDITEKGSINPSGGTLTWSSTPPIEPLVIGDMVNYTTSLNGVTLNNWKVFYVDGDYTYLILDGYLPNSAISTTMKSTYNLTTGGTNSFTEEEDLYNVYAQNNRADLINALSTKSNWNNLLQGTINGHAVNETANANAWAMGSPTLDLWVNSWNAKYPSDTLYTATSSAMSDGLNGYYIGESSSPNDNYVSLSEKAGYDNTLYWISKINDSYGSEADDYGLYGYWLASPSAYDVSGMMNVICGGRVGDYGYNGYDHDYLACRPVVCLPSSVVNQ